MLPLPALAGLLASLTTAASVNYPVPAAVPSDAAALDSTPVAVAFEFDLWPTWMLNLTHSLKCMDHLTQLYDGVKVPVRIGGTTQDRSAYDPTYDGYIYDNPDIELNRFYGPKFFDLIGTYGGETILGLNRGDDNITNTLEAAMVAKSMVAEYLWAVELGNEPDIYLTMWNKSVAVAPWNSSQEGENQAEWSQAFLDVWGEPTPILSAGTYAVPIELAADWPNTDYLINEAFNSSVQAGVKMYCTHSYALSPEDAELPEEMNHSKTVADLSNYVGKIATARSVDRPYIIGEAGFHGLETSQDATFGGALQVLDKAMHALSMGVQRIYHHQGGPEDARNWWGQDTVAAPFYGGYFAALAIAGADGVVASDPGNGSYAQYVVYEGGAARRVVLVNTDYYSGDGERTTTTFTLAGLGSAAVKALRMTAPSSEVTAGTNQEPTLQPTIGGQYFSHDECAVLGDQVFEDVETVDGTATLSLVASEAVLVYL